MIWLVLCGCSRTSIPMWASRVSHNTCWASGRGGRSCVYARWSRLGEPHTSTHTDTQISTTPNVALINTLEISDFFVCVTQLACMCVCACVHVCVYVFVGACVRVHRPDPIARLEAHLTQELTLGDSQHGGTRYSMHCTTPGMHGTA